jgi:hypothetical protein
MELRQISGGTSDYPQSGLKLADITAMMTLSLFIMW